MRLLLSLLLFSSFLLQAQEIHLGMSTALSGQVEQLGLNMRMGVETYLKKINEASSNHKYLLTVLDDQNEPEQASLNVRELIDVHNVLAVIGNVGTITANVTVPIVNAKKTLLFGALSGAEILRKKSPDNYIVNYRASLREETASIIEGLLSLGIKPKEIALFTQNDGYGDDGYYGVFQALAAKGLSNSLKNMYHGKYRRNTLNVENALAIILDTQIDIKAFVIVGTYSPVAKFIKLAKEDFPDALFLNVSSVGSEALKNELGKDTDNVIITQVVPLLDSSLPIVKEYKMDLKKYYPEAKPNFVSLEGYIVSKIFVSAAEKLDKENISKESIVTSIKNEKNLTLDFMTAFKNNTHQFSHEVWLTKIQNNGFVEFNWKNLTLRSSNE